MRSTAVSAFFISSIVAFIRASSFLSFSLKNSACAPLATLCPRNPFLIASSIAFSCCICPSEFATEIKEAISELISRNRSLYFLLFCFLILFKSMKHFRLPHAPLFSLFNFFKLVSFEVSHHRSYQFILDCLKCFANVIFVCHLHIP